MSTEDRVYFVRRAAEEMELAKAATDPAAIEAHRALQRKYAERASNSRTGSASRALT